MTHTATWLRAVLVLGSALAALPFVAACTPEDSRPGAASELGSQGCVDRDKDGFGENCGLGPDCNDDDPKITSQCRACLGNEPGCPCANEGKRIECGKVASREGNQVRCLLGGQVCQGGLWSACSPGAYAPGHDGWIQTKTFGGPPNASPGSCQDCDPHCHLFTDDLSGSGFQGIPGTQVPSNAPPSQQDLTILQSAPGGLPPGAIFKTLLPGQVSSPSDPIDVVDPRPAGGDVYFLLDDTGSMAAVANALRDAIAQSSGQQCQPDPASPVPGGRRAAAGGGIVENLICKFGNDVFIGVGRYEDYSDYLRGPPESPTAVSRPFEHILSMQPDAVPAQNATGFAITTAYTATGFALRGGGDIPESLVPALFSAITGQGLIGVSTVPTGGWWTVPRSNWTTPWVASPFTPDRANPSLCVGGAGYPCFRTQTTPIFVIVTDAPSHNGPGGQYGYPHYGMGLIGTQLLIHGAAASPQIDQPPNNAPGGNPPVAKTFPAANALEQTADGLVPRLYWGTVLPNVTTLNSGNPASWPSNSSISDGEFKIDANNNGRASLRDCSAAQSNVTIQPTAVAASVPTTGFGNADIPSPEPVEYRFQTPSGAGCSAASYVDSLGAGPPHVASTIAATYLGAATVTGGGTTLLPAAVDTRPDGAPGRLVIPVPVAGSRIQLTLRVPHPQQRASFNVEGFVAIGGATRQTLTLTSTGSAPPGVAYTIADNQDVELWMRSNVNDVSARLEWVIVPPTLTCSAPSFVTRDYQSAPGCRTCGAGYTRRGATNECQGADTPVCPTGTFFARNNAPGGGGCPDPGAIANLARARDPNRVGGCFSCASQTTPPEAGRPTTAQVNPRGGIVEATPGCYIQSCENAPTPLGALWQYQSGGALANGTRCVRKSSADMQCTNGSAPICNEAGNLCTPAGQSPPFPRVDGALPAVTTFCGCAKINGTAFDGEHPLAASNSAGTNGSRATYFGSSPAQSPPTGGGWAVPIASQFEPGMGIAANAAVPGTPTLTLTTNFSARWTAQIEAPCNGTFEVTSTNPDDRLWVDGNLMRSGTSPTTPARFNFTAGTRYNVELEFFRGNSANKGTQLSWRIAPGTPTCGGLSNTFAAVPNARIFPTYAPPPNPNVAQCRTQGSYVVPPAPPPTEVRSLGLGRSSPESIYKFTVPAGKTFYYRFALLRNDRVGPTQRFGETPTHAFLYLKRESEALAAANSRVIDCNQQSTNWNLSSDAIRSELNGKVGPGTYYLVIDSTQGFPNSSFNYLLQVNQFAEPPTKTDRTAPTYEETVARLVAQNAKVIGVENSGVSCGQANEASFAQYETRDHLEKLAIDTGSLDQNAKPIVVSLKRDARSCGRDPVTGAAQPVVNPPESLTASLNEAVNTLANTLRQDVVIRAVREASPPNADTIDVTSKNFAAEDFVDIVTADAASTNGRCGGPQHALVPVVAADFDQTFGASLPARQMFQGCLPGAPLRFNVTFRVPSNLKRTNDAQFFRFDLLVHAVGRDQNGAKFAGTVLTRIPVVIKVPPLSAGTATVVRDYDANQACKPGFRPLWDGFGYNSQAPATQAGQSNNIVPNSESRIEFYWSTADDPSGLAAPDTPGMNLFAVSTRRPPLNTTDCTTASVPKTEACTKVDLDAHVIAKNESPHRRYMRIFLKMIASPSGEYLPSIQDWQMFLDCVPNE